MVASTRHPSRLLDPDYTDASGPFFDPDHPRHAEAVANLQSIVDFALPSRRAQQRRPIPTTVSPARVDAHHHTGLQTDRTSATPDNLIWSLLTGKGPAQSDDPAIQPGTQGNIELAGACQGTSAGCQSGGSYGSSAMYDINGRHLCRDCAVKALDIGGLSGPAQAIILAPLLIK